MNKLSLYNFKSDQEKEEINEVLSIFKNKLDQAQIELASQMSILQLKFITYLITENISHRSAYLKAGGKATKISSQDVSATRLFKNEMVKKFYNSVVDSSNKSLILTKNEALRILTNCARVTIKDIFIFQDVQIGICTNNLPIFQTTWMLKNCEDIPEHIACCIKSISMTSKGPKVELYDSHNAISQLSDLLGWKTEQNKQITINSIERKVID